MESVAVLRDGEQLFPRGLLAEHVIDRMLGLLPRRGLEADEALVFPRCRSLHTFFMRFAIDIIFLARGGEVVKLCPSVPRGHVVLGGRRSITAIECGAEGARRHGIELGQRLSWTAS